MLYPQNSRFRTTIDLSGFWQIRSDANDDGLRNKWFHGFTPEAELAVPGSWNEQLSELGYMNYVGKMWYQTRFSVPDTLKKNRHFLHFGSADFHALVWVNGNFAGEHAGGYLPFEFDISDFTESAKENLLVVCVDNLLTHDTIPQGITEENFREFNKERDQSFPSTVFDFFAYGGIHRPVKLIGMPQNHLQKIRLEPVISDADGILKYRAEINVSPGNARLELALFDGENCIMRQQAEASGNEFSGELEIENCKFWSPENPHLYRLQFTLHVDGQTADEYFLETGVREIRIEGDKILLNGRPLFLKGFGKHEDFDVLGKGLSHPVIVKDFQLMKWIGANSFRTSHYPYAEEIIQMADRMGFLVVDEVAAVSLNFKYVTGKTLENHKQAITELIERDCNHPSVIAWSIANEPGIWGEEEALSDYARNYWKEIYDHAKSLDVSRPVTLPTCPRLGDEDPGYKFVDFISVNRYWGWYEIPGNLEEAGNFFRKELENLYEKYQKPILVTEFGADTIEGEHATYPQLFTEEYQAILIQTYFDIIESLPFMAGEHIWNFADFRTAQHHRRLVLNKKGVFTRQRQPKVAAFSIRKHWLREK